MDLKNKVAIVTGASSGIGAAIAILFAKEGAKVVIVGRNETKLKNVSAECEKLGSKPLVIAADISKDPEAKKVIDTTVSQLGKIDILVNNAGIGRPSILGDENSIKVFDEIININLRAPVYFTNLATPHLKASKGNVVNISSIASHVTMGPGNYAYCTSKAALDHFSRCVAMSLASEGVRCNNVNPGPVRTDIIENAGINKEVEEVLWKSMEQGSPLARVSDPNEIAELVIFLASEKAKGITGSTFVSDNGLLLKGGMSANLEKV